MVRTNRMCHVTKASGCCFVITNAAIVAGDVMMSARGRRFGRGMCTGIMLAVRCWPALAWLCCDGTGRHTNCLILVKPPSQPVAAKRCAVFVGVLSSGPFTSVIIMPQTWTLLWPAVNGQGPCTLSGRLLCMMCNSQCFMAAHSKGRAATLLCT